VTEETRLALQAIQKILDAERPPGASGGLTAGVLHDLVGPVAHGEVFPNVLNAATYLHGLRERAPA
jgi:hypothetical protein